MPLSDVLKAKKNDIFRMNKWIYYSHKGIVYSNEKKQDTHKHKNMVKFSKDKVE